MLRGFLLSLSQALHTALGVLFGIGKRRFADFANFGFLAFDFLLVQHFYAITLANGAGSAAAAWQFTNSFSSMCFGHMFLPASFSLFSFFGFLFSFPLVAFSFFFFDFLINQFKNDHVRSILSAIADS